MSNEIAKTPIDAMMDGVDWKACQWTDPPTDELYTTHEGVLVIGSFSLRCFQLNNGQRVFEAGDIKKFFGLE